MRTLQTLMNLKGRRAILTGAAGAIGKHMAIAIAELGGDLILTDRPGSNYDDLLKTLSEFKLLNVDCIDCDLENESSRAEFIAKVLSKNYNINVLINNAGFVGASNLEGWVTSFENQTVETWRRALEVNLTSVFDFSKGFSNKIKQSGFGSIINVSSIYGINGPDYSLYENTPMGNPAAYAASKGGIIQLTRWLATTLSPSIRVNAISPGGVFRNQPDSFVKKYSERTPLERMATEEDFKGITAYLASDLSAYVTGQNILIDGGWTVW